ncbi:hypothetical protein D477_018354 [Arthrobacter crystallopoietes BAB-32]|uniref:Uncharacterized protein n=1 Tax=Arthrobacter crystallopoietes BAB-32 TaxID=1246476 RepID=N1UY55_9MICC|nr:hypothetical protein [Arthrobacter crystallopoietes]EMY32772.1 hypothetical protein D477_018354 [Arthrobacter crystallopoietes BAB-32]
MRASPAPNLFAALRKWPVALATLAAVVACIFGMHVANGTPGTAGTGSVPSTPSIASTAHSSEGVEHPVSSLSLPTGTFDLAHAACAGPCGEEHGAAAVCILLVVLAGIGWLFAQKPLSSAGPHGRRGPPLLIRLAPALPRPPSLVQLSISRT